MEKDIDAPILFFKHDYGYSQGEKFNLPTAEEKQLFLDFCKGADAVGFSVFSGFFPLAKDLILLLRQNNIGTKIIIGGIHATLAPKECIAHADFVIRGDGEVVIDKLVDIVNGKGNDLEPEENLWLQRPFNEKNILKTYDLDLLPLPDWTDKLNWLIEKNKLYQEDHTKHLVEYMCMTSRGCPFACSYCCNSAFIKLYNGKNNLRQRSVRDVILELRAAKKIFPNLGVIDFSDDVFTLDSAWIKEFAENYKKEINMPFFCLVQPNMTKPEDIKLLRKAGLRAVTIGIQSGSKHILYDVYKRYTPPDKIIEAINTINACGVHVVADLIVDNPYETEETLQETFNLLVQLDKPFHLNMPSLSHLPFTDLTERALKEGVIKPESVEGDSTKSVQNWFDYQDSSSSKMHMFWNSLFRMAGYKMISNSWLKDLSKNKYYRENPDKLRAMSFKMVKFCNLKVFKLHRFSSIHIKHMKVRLGL